MIRAGVILISMLLAGAAYADPFGAIIIGAAAGGPFQGAGDVIAAVAWFGLRPYSNATVGNKAVNLIRSSDSHTCDFLSSKTLGLGNSANCSAGGDNGTALATWCNATTCSVVTLYDQTGGLHCTGAACDLTQATAAKRPTITLNCRGSFPCMKFVRASNQYLSETTSVNTGLPNGVAMATAVERTGTTTSTHEYFTSDSWEQIFSSSANTACTFGGVGICGTANDSSWHAIQGYRSVTANDTYVYIDGTKTTGNDTNATLTSGISLGCFNSTTTNCLDGNVLEGGLWDSIVQSTGWTNTQLSNMNTNIHNFWGF